MEYKIAASLLATIGVLGCTQAWAWTKDGDKLRFSATEAMFCQDWAMDAGNIMWARQNGTRTYYVYDEKLPDLQNKMRVVYQNIAKTRAIESTEEKRTAVIKKFISDARFGCLNLYMKAIPPTPAPPASSTHSKPSPAPTAN